jgi:hypothetical protein
MGRKFVVLVVALGCAVAGLVGVATSPASAAATGSPVGAFSDVSSRFDNAVSIGGFALDPDAPGQPITVRFYVGAQWFGETTTTTAPGSSQPIVWTSGPLTADTNTTICAYAINVGPGENALLGCRRLVVASDSGGNPFGALDAVTASPGLVQLKGWAGDPDGDRVAQLRVYYDGKLVAQKAGGVARADVERTYPALGPTTGFNVALPITPGTHQVCAYVENTGVRGTANGTVGCATRSVPGVRAPASHDPRGSLDYVANGPADVFPNTIHTVNGWAYDPDSAAPIKVLVRTLMYRYFVDPPNLHQNETLSTGRPRPDVARVVPAAGPSSGFRGVVAGGPYSYVRITCAYADNVGPGADRLLGCATEDAPEIVRQY